MPFVSSTTFRMRHAESIPLINTVLRICALEPRVFDQPSYFARVCLVPACDPDREPADSRHVMQNLVKIGRVL